MLAWPRRVVVVSTLVCLLLAAAALTAPADMSFLSVLPADDPLVARYLEMNETTGMSRRVVLLLEGPDEALPGATSVVVEALQACPRVEWAAADPDGVPGARVVVASLDSDPMKLDAKEIVRGNAAFSIAEAAVERALGDSPVTVGWTGVPPTTIQDIKATMGRFVWLSPLSLLVVLGLLRVVERRLLRLLLIGVPMLLAVAATLGLSALIFGSITFNEAFFGIVVCGLGADFALHLVVRLREEQAAGHGFDAALRRTLGGAGRAIAAGAATTTGAFLVLAFAPEPMPQRMGVSGALGLTLCLVLMLTWLPATWVLLQRGSDAVAVRPVEVPLVGRLAALSVRRPTAVAAIALVAVALALAGLGRFRYQTDFDRIMNRDVPADEVTERLQERFGANSAPWIVASETMADAHRVHAAFVADPGFVRVDGAADLLPADATDLPAGLPEAVAAQVRGRDGQWLTWAYTADPGLDTERLAAARRRAEGIDPQVAGYGMFIEAVVSMKRPWTRWVGLGILVLVALVLAIDLRSLRHVILAITPAAVGMTITVGALCWMDIGFGVTQVFTVPLLLGLGVDDGLHVVHRLREAPDLAADAAAVSVGRAIVMTTATTCASFCAVMLSNNPSLEGMALVILIGLPICLLASVTLLPAMAVLLKVR